MPPEKTFDKLTPADKEALIAKPIGECSQIEKDLKLQILEERVKGIAVSQDLSKLGPDDLVYITVPLKDDGEMFEINLNKYYGRIKVTKRAAEQLMYMISDHYEKVKERTIDRGNARRKNNKGLRGEDHAVVERYQSMMEG